jgi:hypothetical protein
MYIVYVVVVHLDIYDCIHIYLCRDGAVLVLVKHVKGGLEGRQLIWAQFVRHSALILMSALFRKG